MVERVETENTSLTSGSVSVSPGSQADSGQLLTDLHCDRHTETMPDANPYYLQVNDFEDMDIPTSNYGTYKVRQQYGEFQDQNLYPTSWEYIGHVAETDGMVPGSESFSIQLQTDAGQQDITPPTASFSAPIPYIPTQNYQCTISTSPRLSTESAHLDDTRQPYVTSQTPEHCGVVGLHVGSPGQDSSLDSVHKADYYGPVGSESDFYGLQAQHFSDLTPSSFSAHAPEYRKSYPPQPTIHRPQPQYVHLNNNINNNNNNTVDTNATAFSSWTSKHPDNWSTTEVLDWLYYSADKAGLDCSRLHGESFRTLTGSDLCMMGPEDFSRLEPQYGQHFYGQFRQLLSGLQFTVQHDNTFPDLEATYSFQDSEDSESGGQGHNQGQNRGYHASYPSNGDYSVDFSTMSQTQSTIESLLMQGYDYNASASDIKLDPAGDFNAVEYQQQQYHVTEKHEYPRHSSDVVAKYMGDVTPVRRRPGRPRIKSLPTEEELKAQRDKKLKVQHLWEFIYDILSNPMYNPQVLKWENQNEGIFRFIQSESVAHLWGTQKNNEHMTYEKLSRAMRHYYKRGILERVEGRRLVYKFSKTTLERMREKKHAVLK